MAAVAHKLTFAEHIHELRKRLMWSLLFVAIGAGVGYALHGVILDVLQQPLNEKLYYTNPTGAFSFIIKICVVFGFIVSLPVVVYQAFGFFEPLVPVKTRRVFASYVLVSVMLAAAGITFAYFISLPAALHFLVNFGGDGGNIQALITADEYFNFVLAYIAGFAALFQLPLIIIFINNVKPLKPSQLMSGTRYVVLGSFVVSAVITPTPDPLNQALMAGPVILLYFMSVVVVAAINAAKRRKKAKSSIPEMVFAGLDDLVNGEPDNNEIPLATAHSISVQPIVTPKPMPRRMVSDMIVSPQHKRPTSIARQSQNYSSRPVARPIRASRPSSQPVRMRVISDFIPVSE